MKTVTKIVLDFNHTIACVENNLIDSLQLTYLFNQFSTIYSLSNRIDEYSE